MKSHREALVKVTLRLPVALVVRLDEAARAEGNTRTALVQLYLAQALSERARAFDEMLEGPQAEQRKQPKIA